MGRVTFAQNGTEWVAEVSESWTTGLPQGILPQKSAPPMQCYRYAANDARLRHGILAVQVRYRNQQELLEVARGYKQRNCLFR